MYRLRAQLRKASVSEVLRPSNAGKLSDLYLSDKAKARVKEVQAAIENNTPLYTKDDLDKQGQSTVGVGEHKKLVREDTDADIMQKVAFWRSGAGVKNHVKHVVERDYDEDLERSLGIMDITDGEIAPQYQTRKYKNGEKHTTHFVYCSFCGTQVEETLATREKGGKKVACPEHSLRIHVVKFAETAG